MILDRVHTDQDDLWRTLDFTIYEPSSGKPTVRHKSEGAAGRADANIGGGSGLVVDRVMKTEVKCEPVRTCSGVTIKEEPIECGTEEWSIPSETPTGGGETVCGADEQKEMVEFLQEVRRDW